MLGSRQRQKSLMDQATMEERQELRVKGEKNESEGPNGNIDELEEKLQKFLSSNFRKSDMEDHSSSRKEIDCALNELKKRFACYAAVIRGRGNRVMKSRRVSAQEATTKIDEAENKISRRKKSLSVDDKILLQWAATHNDIGTIQHLVKTKGTSINEPGIDGLYPIHRAACTGGLECLKYLVRNGAQLDVNDQQGISPLDMAVEEGEFDCALYLIESGADIKNIQDGFMDARFLGRMRSDTC